MSIFIAVATCGLCAEGTLYYATFEVLTAVFLRVQVSQDVT